MTTMIIGAIVGQPATPVALRFQAAFAEFNAGYASYWQGCGPGVGRLRSSGWLVANREERQELEARQEERREQF